MNREPQTNKGGTMKVLKKTEQPYQGQYLIHLSNQGSQASWGDKDSALQIFPVDVDLIKQQLHGRKVKVEQGEV